MIDKEFLPTLAPAIAYQLWLDPENYAEEARCVIRIDDLVIAVYSDSGTALTQNEVVELARAFFGLFLDYAPKFWPQRMVRSTIAVAGTEGKRKSAIIGATIVFFDPHRGEASMVYPVPSLVSAITELGRKLYGSRRDSATLTIGIKTTPSAMALEL